MGALADGDPSYTLTYSVPSTGERKTRNITRDRFRAIVEGLRKDIGRGTMIDVVVTDRHGEDVTVDWFG